MIDVVIADHQELFRIGIAEVLADADDIRIVELPQSPKELRRTLKQVSPDLVVLSTSFLSAFPSIQRLLKRRQTALMLLADEKEHVAYVRWIRAQGVIYRTIDGPSLIDAVRRVARGELFVQDRNSDIGEGSSVPESQIAAEEAGT